MINFQSKLVTLDLFVRQRRDGDERELLHQPLVQPVKVLVAPRHLNVVELKQGNKFDSPIQKSTNQLILTLGVSWYAMKLLSPLSLDSFFGEAMEQL